jgi:hypothetical protein
MEGHHKDQEESYRFPKRAGHIDVQGNNGGRSQAPPLQVLVITSLSLHPSTARLWLTQGLWSPISGLKSQPCKLPAM